MTIRRATDSETEEILALSPQAVYEGTLGGIRPTDEKINKLVAPLLKKGAYYLLAAENGRIMGWILLGTAVDQFTDDVHGFIYEVFVIEEYRGNGLSARLLEAAVDALKQQGHTEVRLSAFAGNHAIRLYEKMGFSVRTVSMSLPI